MAGRAIDVRKKSFAPNSLRARDEAPGAISWSALEHEERDRGPYWFLWPGIGALLLVIFGIFAHSYFFITFVVLAFGVILMYGSRPPREIAFSISRDGVDAGATRYPFAELKSFWIFDAPGHRELSLETTRLLMPYIRIPMGETDPRRVARIIVRFLPEEEHTEFVSDHIARSLGF